MMTDLSAPEEELMDVEIPTQRTAPDTPLTASGGTTQNPALKNQHTLEQLPDAQESAYKYFKSLSKTEFKAKLVALQQWAARLAQEEGSFLFTASEHILTFPVVKFATLD
jgi:hypothetical protein